MKDTLLPGRKILVDRTKYYIHGLVHGNPWIKINSSFKKIVNQLLKDVNVLCEDGFVSWIPNASSMRETEYFGFEKIPPLERIRFFGSFFFNYLFHTNKEQDLEIVHKIEKMNSIEDLIGIRDELFTNYSKEPGGMNALMKKKNSGTLNSPKEDIPLKIRRYIYESKIAFNYAQENNLKELHIVVGCAHELPLEYLLTHTEVLDKYSL